ncbi:MAG: helix-turn-helix domain-containing protein [Myxococcales bacterium]|nr:helix-turn-helix domain-containing protein [Myxococcales bacterium]
MYEENRSTTRVFTTGQVARIFSVNINTVIKWFDEGKLEGFRLPRSNERRIYRESVVDFMKSHEISTELLRMFDDELNSKRRARRATSRPPQARPAVDLRTFPRRTVTLPAVLETKDGAAADVVVRNLSMGGAFVTGFESNGKLVPVEFVLRMDVGAMGKTLDGVCQLVHLRRGDDETLSFGCRFTQVDPSLLQAYIASV